MTDKKFKIEFEEGCFDNLDEEFTQEEMDQLLADIEDAILDGSFFENSVSIDELPEEEQEEIYNMINGRKNTRQ